MMCKACAHPHLGQPNYMLAVRDFTLSFTIKSYKPIWHEQELNLPVYDPQYSVCNEHCNKMHTLKFFCCTRPLGEKLNDGIKDLLYTLLIMFYLYMYIQIYFIIYIQP